MRSWASLALVLPLVAGATMTTEAGQAPQETPREPCDPCGRIHLPIGLANSLDSLKTFVEAEGNFSPGFATYGVYFWVTFPDGKFFAPTAPGVAVEHGLAPGGQLIPWSAWAAGALKVKTEVYHVSVASPAGVVQVAAARAHLTNPGPGECHATLWVALRPLGPAGGPVHGLAASDRGDALLVDGHPALVANEKPDLAGVAETDTIARLIQDGTILDMTARSVTPPSGDASGALGFALTLAPGETLTRGFICPVLPGKRAVAHHWDGTSPWAQLDLARPLPAEGGVLQPDPGLDFCRQLKADALFRDAAAYWKDLTGRVRMRLPDPRWAEAFAAITGHVAVAMNEGAPDVAVINYNVFNRDGVYVANILQKSGRFDLAAAAIDYFLAHPFNGRAFPEADNPGQVLWIMGEQWRFTRDEAWLKRVYPAARKLAALIRYYRTTPGKLWVSLTRLDCGDALPAEERREFVPGRCDGQHPEYTEAFDLAGLRAAVVLAQALRQEQDAAQWDRFADQLFKDYDEKYGGKLGHAYGSYCVLWPCRLYPLQSGQAFERFKGNGAQKPAGWRYFPLATAHQGLLAGNRAAGHGTLAAHLEHEQLRGWYAFDEGGGSGPGGWQYARTRWKGGVAMPHGWAIAEFHLVLRDSLVFEDGGRLVLLGGVPPEWFAGKEELRIEGLPTHFGACSAAYLPTAEGATVSLSGAAPPEGYVLRLPETLNARVLADGQPAQGTGQGDFRLPRGTKTAQVVFAR